MKRALILVDIQNDYFPCGKYELRNTDMTIENVKRLLKHFRESGELVVHVQHTFLDDNAPFFVRDTEGVKIYKDVLPQKDEKLISKNYPNSFYKTELDEYLKENGVEEIVICGMMSHVCIDSTTRAGTEQGYKCTVIEDCCTTRDVEFDGKTIGYEDVHGAFMGALGFFADVKNIEEFLK